MNTKQTIFKTIQSYLTSVLIDRDIEKAGVFLAEEIICCDLNTTDFLTSKKEVIANLHEKIEKSVDNCSFQIKDEVINIYGKMATFIGKIIIKRKSNVARPQAIIQYSITLRKEEIWKICASHYSLEEVPQEQEWGFAEENIAGGILSAFIEENSYPLRFINENLLRLLGYTKKEFEEKYGDDVLKIIHPDDYEEAGKEVLKCIEKGEDWRLKHRVFTKDGKILHMLVRGRKSLDAIGREIVTNFSIDMTDMHMLQEKVVQQSEELEAQNEELVAQTCELTAQQEELEAQNEELIAQTDTLIAQAKEINLSEKKFRIALAKSKSTIFDYDIEGEDVHCYNLMHPEEDRVIAITDLEHSLIEKETVYKEDMRFLQNMFIDIKSGDMYAEQDIRTITNKGEKKWYHFLLTAIFDANGDPVHAIGTAEDITRQKKAETDLRYKAETDLLTGIYNKLSSMEKIETKLATPEGIQRGVFMILDIDCFKAVNDSYGHPAGDAILKQVAEVLKNNFRETDIIGRLGGDEFCIFVEGTKNIRLIRQKADIINQEIREIQHPGGKGNIISVSIGITTCNGVQKDFEQVYKEADKALYGAKQKGKDTFCFYDE